MLNWRAAFLVGTGAMIAACSGPPRDDGGTSVETDSTLSLDMGEDWAEGDRRGGSRGGATAGALAGESSLGGRRSFWSVILQTFPANGGPGQSGATELLRRMQPVDPGLSQAFIHTTDEGSMVLFGRHRAPDSEAAQADLAYIKGIEVGEQPLFPRAMLTRIQLPRDPASYGPHELLSTRIQNPQHRDIYTFQVAAWGTFSEYARRGESALSWDEVQDAAEEQARELRARGFQAYYHHDEDKELSMVTIGVFDRTAYDVQSGLYLDPRIDRLVREFPAHLVNGEPVMMQRGSREVPQPPLLVEVPELP